MFNEPPMCLTPRSIHQIFCSHIVFFSLKGTWSKRCGNHDSWGCPQTLGFLIMFQDRLRELRHWEPAGNAMKNASCTTGDGNVVLHQSWWLCLVVASAANPKGNHYTKNQFWKAKLELPRQHLLLAVIHFSRLLILTSCRKLVWSQRWTLDVVEECWGVSTVSNMYIYNYYIQYVLWMKARYRHRFFLYVDSPI